MVKAAAFQLQITVYLFSWMHVLPVRMNWRENQWYCLIPSEYSWIKITSMIWRFCMAFQGMQSFRGVTLPPLEMQTLSRDAWTKYVTNEIIFSLYLQPRTCQKKGRHTPTQLSSPVLPRLQQVMQYICIYPKAFSLTRLKLVPSLC